LNREKVKTPLEGFKGPVFPRIVDDLNAICDRVRPDSVILKRMTENLKSPFFDFDGMNTLTTEDDHDCCVLHFETSLGKIAVLFPQSNERSIAVYADGELRRGPQSYGEFETEIDAILRALKQGLSELDKEQKESQEPVFIKHM